MFNTTTPEEHSLMNITTTTNAAHDTNAIAGAGEELEQQITTIPARLLDQSHT